MNQSIFQEAMRTVNERRVRAQAENERRFREVNEKLPQIAEINHQLAQTATKFFEVVKSGRDVEGRIEELRRQNEQAQEMSSRILTENGYPADYLDVRYTCEKCQDTGYFEGRYCECLQRAIASAGIARMNENAQLRLSTFEQFSLDYYRLPRTSEDKDTYETMQRVYHSCRKYADSFTVHSPSILFYGRTGVGKTHLSLAIADRVLAQGYDVIYDSIINLLSRVEREHFGREESELDTLSLLLGTDLLILDDLGTEWNTPFYVATIYNIVNTRINKGLPTIINTNLDLLDLRSRYEERIVSRLFAVYETMNIVGPDIRLLKKKQNGPAL
ncbi:MAG: ATP-binding protein [Oscillospiraceae bacterium]|nr:ATP-binding protein [Oscillospiraceae bacterium]